MLKEIEALYLEPRASKLQEKRNTARGTGKRLTYDCFNCIPQGGIALCREGRPIGHGGKPLSLQAVLEGRRSRVCQECPSYTPEANSYEGEVVNALPG